MEGAKEMARVFAYLSRRFTGDEIGVTKLNKLLYFAQGHALAELGHGLFPNEIDAWQQGPVVAVVYHGFQKILEESEKHGAAGVHLTPEEMNVALSVWKRYGGLTATRLVEMTHEKGGPWERTYIPGRKNVHIPLPLIQEYFSRPEQRLPGALDFVKDLPTVSVLPIEEYDPEEDALWEAMLHEGE